MNSVGPSGYQRRTGHEERKRYVVAAARPRRPRRAQPHSGALLVLGNVAFGPGEIEAATSFWMRAIDAVPGNAAAQVNLSLALAERRDAFGAARHARAAVQADPAMMRGHYALGYALALQGRFAEAEAAYRAALAREPENTTTLRELSATLTELQRPAEALALQDAARRLRPDEPAGGNCERVAGAPANLHHRGRTMA